MAHFEIEIKTLLGEKKYADALKEKMCELDPKTACISTNKQLNHYFEGGDIEKLYEQVVPLFDDDAKNKLKRIVEKGNEFSIRTRQKDKEIFLVLKASIDEGTSANTISRLEFEETVDMPLDTLDQLVLDAGFSYQAKWSREREEYAYKDAIVCLDRNAGYGYLAEFEKVVEEEDTVAEVRKELEEIMNELGVDELPQDRLERMFAHYNKHWPDYYGTERTFVIE